MSYVSIFGKWAYSATGLSSDFDADFPERASRRPIVSDLQDIYPEHLSDVVLFKPASGLNNHIDRLVLVS